MSPDLSPLKGMPLRELLCGHSQVSDLSPLRRMPLTNLYCEATRISDLSPLQGMKLKELMCNDTRVSDLSPLQGMPLTVLHCNGTEVSGLSPLKGMPMTALDCSRTLVADLSPLHGMPLTRLECTNTQVFDLSPLRGMPLTTLYCDFTAVADLSPLQGMPLTQLQFGATKVSDLSPLKGMRLAKLHFGMTPASDLSPLRGMPLTELWCEVTPTTDLSPLEGMSLRQLGFTPKTITKGLGIIRQMQSLQAIAPTWDKRFPPAEFWKRYDAGEFKPITTFKDPAFIQWTKDVAALPAEKQVEAVAKKLQELNPGFDGQIKGVEGSGSPTIENGIVRELGFVTDNVTDISPVRALAGLRYIVCTGSSEGKGRLSDLSPLQGMRLTKLNCGFSPLLYDLSPLRGMPLTYLGCIVTQVFDLSPLQGMPLTELYCASTQISDLSPLAGVPLTLLWCYDTRVSDLSPLTGMSLKTVSFTPKNITTGIDAIRRMKSLSQIGLYGGGLLLPPADFWKRYDAGEFGKPLTMQANPAFQQWMKAVAAMAAEQQVEAVAKKLRELNPGFDGKKTHWVDHGVATKLFFTTDNVTDISPVRALAGLKELGCAGSNWKLANGRLSDLSPLTGLSLTSLRCDNTQVSDLSPLKGMPLTNLRCNNVPHLSDLSPLQGMPLRDLEIGHTQVSDLLPLKGMQLAKLACDRTQVSDLSPLQGMQLSTIFFTPKNITTGIDGIRQMKTVKTIALGGGDDRLAPDEFWKKYDAGEFNK